MAVLASAVPASAYLVYVSNEKDNTIGVIDSGKLQVVKTFKVGRRPRGITMTKDGVTFCSAPATRTALKSMTP